MPPNVQRIRTLGCEVDPLTMQEAIETLKLWLREAAQTSATPGASPPPCRFVVTPNLDHAVLLKESEDLRQAYQAASLILADGMPLIWAARLLGKSLKERVAGSDLTPNLLAAAESGTKVFLLGASDDSSARAAENIRSRYPQIEVVGRLSPPFGFEKSAEWSDKIVSEIRSSGASLVLVGFGAPKQELWVHRHHERLPGTILLCVGATIDFLGGTVKRAPSWTHKLGAEWLHRLASDPKRLARRYAKDAIHLPGLLLKDLFSGKQS